MGANIEKVLDRMAELACDYAFAYATQDLKTLRGGRSCFYPEVDYDRCEIGVGVNPEYHYLVYQNDGFASYPMRGAYGKTISMWVNGQLIFRKCTGINQFRSGTRAYWVRGADGELLPETRQARAWVHPGSGPKHFLDDAVESAVSDCRSEMVRAVLQDGWSDARGK